MGEEDRNLILSEKDAMWSKFSGQVNVGDIFEARVGSVEDYGAFVHLRFPDGTYKLLTNIFKWLNYNKFYFFLFNQNWITQ